MGMNEYFINNATDTIPSNTTSTVIRRSKALDYHQSLPAYQSTQLVSLPGLAKKYEVGNIYVKDESHRFGLNAFKGLGASYAIHKILEKQPDIATFCTATDGNHGRAVAWASRLAGKKAIVFVPKDTVESRVKAIEGEGAVVINTGLHYDETCEIARETSLKEGWQLVQDTAWKDYEEIPALIKAGYQTHFQELENEIHSFPSPKIDLVFLQAGVGSWAGSAIWYYLNRYGKNRPKIVVVEPYEAAGILASFEAGKRVSPNGTFKTIMAGLNCGIPSSSSWDIIKSGTDVIIKIKDEFAEQAIRTLFYPNGDDPRIVAGESGVGGLAGFIALMTKPDMQILRDTLGITQHTNILFYNTEGATDPINFNKIISLKP